MLLQAPAPKSQDLGAACSHASSTANAPKPSVNKLWTRARECPVSRASLQRKPAVQYTAMYLLHAKPSFFGDHLSTW